MKSSLEISYSQFISRYWDNDEPTALQEAMIRQYLKNHNQLSLLVGKTTGKIQVRISIAKMLLDMDIE